MLRASRHRWMRRVLISARQTGSYSTYLYPGGTKGWVDHPSNYSNCLRSLVCDPAAAALQAEIEKSSPSLSPLGDCPLVHSSRTGDSYRPTGCSDSTYWRSRLYADRSRGHRIVDRWHDRRTLVSSVLTCGVTWYRQGHVTRGDP